MDSISQFVLGSAVGILVSPKKTTKVAIISGVIATLPDLDVVIDHGNDLLNTVNHRGNSHSLFYLTLASPLLALLLCKFFKFMSFYKWLLLVWLVFITHVILDSLTIYGTALFLPFSEQRVMLGSVFIIDPIFTIPLLFNLIYLIRKKSAKFNNKILTFGTLYLALGLTYSLGFSSSNSFATPTPFNTYLWRVVEIDENNINQYFTNIFGQKQAIKTIKNNKNLFTDDNIEKYANFSSGFYNLREEGDKLILYDLRMGTIFSPVFSFVVAEKSGDSWQSITPYQLSENREMGKMFGD